MHAKHLIAVVLLALMAGCEGGRSDAENLGVAGAAPQRGAALIRDYGCGSCHLIPGIDGAEGLVGPPLTAWALRSYIAGTLPNNPKNLVRWLTETHEVAPNTAMPELDLTEKQAGDIAAYLYTLREENP